ncbi:hypothetical protein D6C84_09085 [Aureobasidium pullulans]|uniref:EF-hand domain-containing protein n=1 Tax=Aureobasidium pullulans TaxID=5580 RepID=A0A4S9X908_AURPU|nr:hypothetical protein D6C84_09085 [Aureobasidium pullulans]
MSTPNYERPEPTYHQPSYHLPSYNVNPHGERSSDEEGTVVGDHGEHRDHSNHSNHRNDYGDRYHDDEHEGPIDPRVHRMGSHLTVDTANDPHYHPRLHDMTSPSQSREMANRLDDDLELLKIERQISHDNDVATRDGASHMGRQRSRRDDMIDEFDIATNPIHEQTQMYKPPQDPVGKFSKLIKKIHHSSFLVRYLTYILPVVLILLIPLLIGALVSPAQSAKVGGVELMWFMIWLEIVWLTLWAGRLLAKCLPYPIGLISTIFTNNSKKWRDMGKQLELPATLFFWWLGVEVSFLPTMKNHQANGSRATQPWMGTMNKVLVALFVGMILNFVEKIIIQLIAISFHLRTYADRIELNKFQIGSLVKLYTFSKAKIAMEDSEFEQPSGVDSGARTPGRYLQEAQKQTKEIFNKVGDVAGKMAGDFTGKSVTKSTHPHQVVLTLLGSTNGSQVLARRLYRTFARPETETVYNDDLKNAFDNDEEAEAAFSMFDKDMNGDISMEELEAVCVEIGRERKSITASLKDLDSVVGKLDDMFMFLVAVITILVFISLISTSAAGVLTSAGSTVLGLSWLFSATATEILQSIIFVFVKHPFDVGDRVTIYGSTGATLTGDDYFVKEIALLYTEFKKMEGHVVQAPNSYLNTLFILNQRRSGGLAEAVPVVIKFGTTLEQIESLRNRLLDFVKQENREYQGNILTELRSVTEVHSLTLNVVFFYKSNWQNEGLRLARRNKFICALMVTMQECGIEGPRMRFPGQKESFPVYMQNIPHQATPGMGRNGHPDNPTGWQEGESQDPPFVAPAEGPIGGRARQGSILRTGSTARRGHETLAQMNKRVDFSLGMSAEAATNYSGDVFEDRKPRLPISVTSPSPDNRNRTSNDTHRSTDTGRSTSRDIGPGRLARRSTDASTTSRVTHRNRFFGRARGNTIDEQAMMEKGMADIPEDSPGGAGTIDPRSGLVSGAAWRTRTNESNVVRKSQERPRTGHTADTAGHSVASGGLDGPPQLHPGDPSTEDFEMKRFH